MTRRQIIWRLYLLIVLLAIVFPPWRIFYSPVLPPNPGGYHPLWWSGQGPTGAIIDERWYGLQLAGVGIAGVCIKLFVLTPRTTAPAAST